MKTMKPVLVVQHVAGEGPGLLGRVLEEHGLAIELVGPADPLPEGALERAAGIIALGGPMGVHETAAYPRLREEVALLASAMARDLPVLGICLGSQLLASALGARVYPAPSKEIGWFDVTREAAAVEDALGSALPPVFTALHWHGDVFDLPPGARILARSAMTARQAFSVGRAWGLLFHLEAGVEQTAAMASAFPGELAEAGSSPEAIVADALRHAADVERVGRAVFTRWAAMVRA